MTQKRRKMGWKEKKGDNTCLKKKKKKVCTSYLTFISLLPISHSRLQLTPHQDPYSTKMPSIPNTMHTLAKRDDDNFAHKNPGVIVVFAIVGAVAILLISLWVRKKIAARRAAKNPN